MTLSDAFDNADQFAIEETEVEEFISELLVYVKDEAPGEISVLAQTLALLGFAVGRAYQYDEDSFAVKVRPKQAERLLSRFFLTGEEVDDLD